MKETTEQEPSTELGRALKDRKIIHSGEEELKQTLLYIYAIIGLRGENYPKGIEKDLLHTYIRDFYGGHTSKELRLAFTMAIQNRLSVDATVFENFTPAYFSKVMESYREWAREEVKQVVKQKSLEYRPAKYVIEMEYAYCKLKEKNKLPCKLNLK